MQTIQDTEEAEIGNEKTRCKIMTWKVGRMKICFADDRLLFSTEYVRDTGHTYFHNGMSFSERSVIHYRSALSQER